MHPRGHEGAILDPGERDFRLAAASASSGGKQSVGDKTKAQAKKFNLTKREMQILTLVVAGRTNREIAKRFSISEQTVKHHVTNIFDKVGAYNRLELALFAIHHGLTSESK